MALPIDIVAALDVQLPIIPVPAALQNIVGFAPDINIPTLSQGAPNFVNEQFQLPVATPSVTSLGGGDVFNDAPGANDAPLSKFIAKARTTDFARASKFKVEIAFPQKVFATEPAPNLSADLNDLVTLFCDSAVMPGFEFDTHDFRIYGPSFQRPGIANYGGSVALQFLVDKDFKIKSIFEAWMHLIVNPDTYVQTYSEDFLSSGIVISALSHADPQYKSSPKDIVTHAIRLIEAWPVSIQPMAWSYTSPDIQRLLVTFSYRKWTSIYGNDVPPFNVEDFNDVPGAG